MGRLLLRLIDATEGAIFFEGTDINSLSRREMRQMRRKAQMVFQDPYGSLSPRRSIADIIAEPLEAFGIVRGRTKKRERVAELLTQVGLSPSTMDRYPRQFSGGQRQRIGIARAISVDPSFIVADEPVSALDVSIQAQIVNLLQDLQEQKHFSYLFIAHDLAVVRHIADRVMVMYLGRIVEMGRKQQIYSAPQHPYTQALLSAAPQPDPDIKANAHHPRRRCAEPNARAARMQLSHPLPACAGSLPDRAPRPARRRARPERSLSFRETKSDSGLTLRRRGSDVAAAGCAIAI